MLKFGNVCYNECGKTIIEILVSDYEFDKVSTYVIGVDVSFLLILEMMIELRMIIDFDNDTATSKLDGWTIQLSQKLEHSYIEWTPTIMYIERELCRLHCHFYTPWPERLFTHMRLVDPDKTPLDTLSKLMGFQA